MWKQDTLSRVCNYKTDSSGPAKQAVSICQICRLNYWECYAWMSVGTRRTGWRRKRKRRHAEINKRDIYELEQLRNEAGTKQMV